MLSPGTWIARLLLVNLVLALALAGSYWGRHIDDASVSQPNFLQSLNVPFRGWATSDEHVDPHDIALLQPDSLLIRDYHSPNGANAQLAVIAGHRKQSVHTPAFCMAGGGWETISQREIRLRLGDESVPAVRAVMQSGRTEIVTTYFFTDGAYSTTSLPAFQVVQLVKRMRRRVPMGALVRIIVPVQTSEKQADTLSDEFAAATVPQVLASLRAVRLNLR